MQKNIAKVTALILSFTLFAMSSTAAFTHERQVFEVAGEEYLFVIGSPGEPVFTGDKSGVDLRVFEADPVAPEDSQALGAVPVEGLEESLQVEVSADGSSKVLDLGTVFGEVGSYKAEFVPTEETTYSYRVFGTLNETEVDLNFTCNPAGHGQAEESTTREEISETVARTFKTGAFGCPTARESVMFPEAEVNESSDDNTYALLLGGLGAILGAVAIYRTRN